MELTEAEKILDERITTIEQALPHLLVLVKDIQRMSETNLEESRELTKVLIRFLTYCTKVGEATHSGME